MSNDPQAPIASRAQRIIAQLFQQATAILRPDFEAMLDRATADIDAAPGSRSRACCGESLAALRRHRGDCLPAFLGALHRASLEGVPASPVATRSVGLQLLDEDAVDEAGTLSAIAERHQFRASLPLLLLGQRFGVLLGTPPLAAADVPVGPRAAGIALAGIARRYGLCLHARLQLYRAYDLVLMPRYPQFAEALDAVVDRAGVLPGLAFVPLRPRNVPGHSGRGLGTNAGGEALQPEAAAMDAVNRALDELRQIARLPDARAAERREVIAAMARFLQRHGAESAEWAEGMQVARSVMEAVRRREPAPPEVRRWMEDVLRSLGYAAEDAERLAVGLVTAGAAAPSEEPPSAVEATSRGAREQRCFERLASLRPGTLLGFSGPYGALSFARVRYHYAEPRLVLLADEADGEEALHDLDSLARRMAEGEVWVIRNTAPVAEGGPGVAGAEVAGADRQQPRGDGA
jgi:hypothetical protein